MSRNRSKARKLTGGLLLRLTIRLVRGRLLHPRSSIGRLLFRGGLLRGGALLPRRHRRVGVEAVPCVDGEAARGRAVRAKMKSVFLSEFRLSRSIIDFTSSPYQLMPDLKYQHSPA